MDLPVITNIEMLPPIGDSTGRRLGLHRLPDESEPDVVLLEELDDKIPENTRTALGEYRAWREVENLGNTVAVAGRRRRGEVDVLIYCLGPRSPTPTNLYDYINNRNIEPPTWEGRIMLCVRIVRRLRALLCQYQFAPVGLRLESVIVFEDPTQPDTRGPQIVDLARAAHFDMYRHPWWSDPASPRWVATVYSLLMILSEVLEWRPMPRGHRTERDLADAQDVRVVQVQRQPIMGVEWSVSIFRYSYTSLVGSRTQDLHQLPADFMPTFFDTLEDFLWSVSDES